jgi:hypothetical protein
MLLQMHQTHCTDKEDPQPTLDTLKWLKAKHVSASGQLTDKAWSAIILAALLQLYWDMLCSLYTIVTALPMTLHQTKINFLKSS